MSPVIYRGGERPNGPASEPTNAKEPDLDRRPFRLARARRTIIFGEETSIGVPRTARICVRPLYKYRLLVFCADLERVDITPRVMHRAAWEKRRDISDV